MITQKPKVEDVRIKIISPRIQFKDLKIDKFEKGVKEIILRERYVSKNEGNVSVDG